ncbi:MAG: hypothetical protein MO853_01275 [Candidatus Protistobacter heckmanni]|nr:hypothetical protein [Candidatus Protistobacter heckmanni]
MALDTVDRRTPVDSRNTAPASSICATGCTFICVEDFIAVTAASTSASSTISAISSSIAALQK